MRVVCVVFTAVWAVFSGTLQPANFQTTTPSSFSTMTTTPASTGETTTDFAPVLTRNPVTVRCPENVTLYSSKNMTEVYWEPPSAEGVQETLTVTRTSTHCPGTLFPVGRTEVAYAFLTSGKLITSCTFYVTIIFDNTPPDVRCPAIDNIQKTIPYEMNVIPVSWEPPVAIKGQENLQETSNYRPGDEFSVGIYIVTYSFADLAGNVAMCNLTVNVTQERFDPITVINCREEGVSLTVSTLRSTVRLDDEFIPRAEGPETNLNVFPASYYYTAGVTSVTYTFTDVKNAANIATCKFNVTVIPVCPTRYYAPCNFNSDNSDPTCIPTPLTECNFGERTCRDDINSTCRYAGLLNSCVRYSGWFSPEDASAPQDPFFLGDGPFPGDGPFSGDGSIPRDGPFPDSNEISYNFNVPGIFQTPIHLSKVRVAWSRFPELFSSHVDGRRQGVTIYADVFVNGTAQTSTAAFWVYPGLTKPTAPTEVFLKVPLLVQTGQQVRLKLFYVDDVVEGPCTEVTYFPLLTVCSECVSLEYSTHNDADCSGTVCLQAYATRNQQQTTNEPPVCRDDQREQNLRRILDPCFPPPEFQFVTPSMSSDIGSIVLLTCVGSGITEPTVAWFNETNTIVAQGNGVAIHRLIAGSSPKSFTCVLNHAASGRVDHETPTTVSPTTEECSRQLQDVQKFETDYPGCLAFSQVPGTGPYSLEFSGWKTNVLVHQISTSSRLLYSWITESGLWPFAQPTNEPVFVSLGLQIQQLNIRPQRKRRGGDGGYQYLYQKVFDSLTVSQDREVNLKLEIDPPLVGNGSFLWLVEPFNPDRVGVRRRFRGDLPSQYSRLHFLTCTNSTELKCTDSLVRDWERALLSYTSAGCSRKQTQDQRSRLNAYKTCKGISSSAPEIRRPPSSVQADIFQGPYTSFYCIIENAVEYHWYKTAPVGKDTYIRSGNQLSLYTSFEDQGAYVCEGVGGRPYQDMRVRTKPALLVLRGTATFQLEMRLTRSNYPDDYEETLGLLNNELGSDLQRIIGPSEPRVLAFSPSDSRVKVVLFMYLLKGEAVSPRETVNYSLLREEVMSRLRNRSSSFRHPVDIRSINIVNLGACEREVVGDLTFPQTRIEQTASSLELCPQFTTRDGLPQATRACVGDFSAEAYWDDPVISSCFEGNVEWNLAYLANILVTPENAEDIARETEILTSNLTTISPQALFEVARILQNLVAANATSARTASSFISIVNNILQLEEANLNQADNNNSPSRILQSLEAYVTALQLASGPPAPTNFSEVHSNLAVYAVKVPRSSLVSGLGFASLQDLNSSDQLTEERIQIISGPESFPEVEASIYLPSEILEQIPRGQNEQVPISFFLYQSSALFRSPTLRSTENREEPFRRAVGSRVIAATVEGVRIQNLAEPIASEFYLLNVSKFNETVTSAQCVFWDFALNDGFGDWSTEGCRNESMTDGVVRCLCDHLTSFAVIVDIYGQEEGHIAVDIISKFGCVVSVLALLITVITFLYSKKLRSKVPQQILISLCFALLGLYFVFLVGIEATASGAFCVIVALLIHYFTLAAIGWMAMEAFNMYLLFVKVLDAKVSHFLRKASMAAWGLPLAVVIITLAVDHTVYINPDYCFLKAGNAVYFGQILPIVLVLLFNFVIFVLVMHKLTCARKTIASTSNKSKRQETVRRLQNAVAISVLLGLTWIFGIFSVLRASNFAFQILFVLFNSLQGLAIFLLFCVRQAEVRQVWLDMFRCKRKKARFQQNVSGTGTGIGTSGGNESTTKSGYELQSKSLTDDAAETL